MKIVLFLLIFLLTSCSTPKLQQTLNHMRKSLTLESILSSIDEINYDESFSELDRDKLRLSFAQEYYHEVSTLTTLLKQEKERLPNQRVMQTKDKKHYEKITTLLESNLLYLQNIIQAEKVEYLNPAIKNITQSCVTCHALFKSVR